MTLIHNTTNIPNTDIELIASIVKPKDIPNVSSISLRNKQEGDINGNWGKFYKEDYRITLCVPQQLKDYKCHRLITKKEAFYKNRYDFLAAVIGHEYYHAWQSINDNDCWHVKDYLEVGAERYEQTAIDLWFKYKEESNWIDPPQAFDQKIAATGQVKWRDYR